MNGKIRVQVLNTLTNDLDAIIIVSVRGAPNLEMAIPCEIDRSVSLQDQYFLQSGEGAYIGETVKSIRDVCHRSTPCGFFRGAPDRLHMYTIPVTGVPRGVGLNGGDTQLKVGLFYGLGSVSPHSYYQWFSSGYSCARSSHRFNFTSVGSNRPGGSETTGDIITVDRGIDKITTNYFTEDPTYPALKVRPASDSRSTLSGTSGNNSFTLWSALSQIGNGASHIDPLGGSVAVPYQSVVKFQPSNQYYDFYRLVDGLNSGSLIGEPIYNYAIGPAHNGAKLLALASFFYPQDAVKIVTNTNSADVGTTVCYTSAGADMAFGPFCNAPTWFKSRDATTFTNGSSSDLNALVLGKMLQNYAEGDPVPV
jgi:hypothetical protein